MNVEREQQLVSAFVVPRKRERYVEMVSSKKARAKFLQSLYHFGDFDLAWVVAAPHAAEDTIAELQRRGAPDDCYIISVSKELDGLIKPLEDVIRERIAPIEGSIVCCVRRELAYFEGEPPQNRLILHRSRSNNRLQPAALRAIVKRRV